MLSSISINEVQGIKIEGVEKVYEGQENEPALYGRAIKVVTKSGEITIILMGGDVEIKKEGIEDKAELEKNTKKEKIELDYREGLITKNEKENYERIFCK